MLLSTDETRQVNIATAHKNNCKYEKLLGIKIDSKLSFDDHIENMCKKAGAKLNALTRVTQYMNTEKKALNYDAFFRHKLIIVSLLGCSAIGPYTII